MTTAERHYSDHLAPIYVWMAGGLEVALQAGSAEIQALALPTDRADVVDLGAGFGMHSIPLARLGARVTSIDSSHELLCTLDKARGALPINIVNDDLLAFPDHITESPSAILCMGDTITHLPTFESVDLLIERAAKALRAGGVFVATFRDYTVPLSGDLRFIPVRSDATRILTCFLEYEGPTVLVHDILHEKTTDGWHTRISHYRKLRLSPWQLTRSLQSQGFDVRQESGSKGLVRLIGNLR